MIEMPDIFERHMTLGKKAFEDKDYQVASENFEAAYMIENNEIANFYLVQSLFQLKAYEQAYAYLSEKKRLYFLNESMQKQYFDLLIQLNYFFEIEVFLATLKVDERVGYQRLYEVAKAYQLSIKKEEFIKVEEALLTMGAVIPSQQVRLIKELKYLPVERVGKVAKILLIEPNVSIFAKTELIQQLALADYDESLDVLTVNGDVRTITPNQVLPLRDIYQNNRLLKKARDLFEKKSPTLQKAVEQTIKLHIGCLYPFHDFEMKAVDDWLDVYCQKYLVDNTKTNLSTSFTKIAKQQEKLDQEIAKLLQTES